MKTATYVRDVSWIPEADQALYQLSRPLRYAGEKFDHVVVSLISSETSTWTKHREVAVIPSDRRGQHYGFHSIHYVHQQWEALEELGYQVEVIELAKTKFFFAWGRAQGNQTVYARAPMKYPPLTDLIREVFSIIPLKLGGETHWYQLMGGMHDVEPSDHTGVWTADNQSTAQPIPWGDCRPVGA